MAQLEVDHITKRFPGVTALDKVSLQLYAGEVHAICGENGAGKSTLMNIISGNLEPDDGRIKFRDIPISIDSPRQAFEIGIATVHQHLSLVENLSVAENIFANRHPVNSFGLIAFTKLFQNTKQLLNELGLSSISPDVLVGELSPAQRQLVEIAKALSIQPAVLILDEPTASLGEKETKILFTILRRLTSQGVGIFYISHRLEEIFEISDRISILKDGAGEGTFETKALDRDTLIRKMIGRESPLVVSANHRKEEILLDVHQLTGERFTNISFQVRRGEIVGFAGLAGAGRSEVARAIFGYDRFHSGKITLRDIELKPDHPATAVSAGIAYVPEERKRQGLFSEMTVAENIIPARIFRAGESWKFDSADMLDMAQGFVDKLRIATPYIDQKVTYLSGGNQQKVLLARWLLTEPRLLIIDEPTHGIDIGARYEIYDLVRTLAAAGKGILVISSDLSELLNLCDRILVLNQGNLAGSLTRSEATEERIMALASN